MDINSKQAATKLKVSSGTVLNLVREGKLKDISGKTGRHQIRLNSKEVSALAKVYKPRKHYKNMIHPISVNGDNGNGNGAAKMSGFFSRLDRIENKLDKLIKMWE